MSDYNAKVIAEFRANGGEASAPSSPAWNYTLLAAGSRVIPVVKLARR